MKRDYPRQDQLWKVDLQINKQQLPHPLYLYFTLPPVYVWHNICGKDEYKSCFFSLFYFHYAVLVRDSANQDRDFLKHVSTTSTIYAEYVRVSTR